MELKAYSAKTDKGPFLQINEDDYSIDHVNELYLLFDGFGGAGIGDMTVKTVKEDIQNYYTRLSDDVDSTMPFFYSPRYLLEGNALINSVTYSHKKLFKSNQKSGLNERGGSCGIFASGSDNILNILGVGNCRAYRLRRGKIEKIIDDDSIRLLADNYDKSHLRTCPLNGLGLFEDFQYSFKEVRVEPSDVFIFLTDGVYSRIEDYEIENVINKSIMHLGDAVDELLKLSNQRGNLDNQSVVVLQF